MMTPKSKKLVAALLASALAGFVANAADAALIAGWDFSSIPAATVSGGGFGPSPMSASSTAANVTVGGLTRGAGVTTSFTSAANGWGGTSFEQTSQANAISIGDYGSFTVTASAGFNISFSDIAAYNIRRSGTGPTTGLWQYRIGADSFVDIGSPISWGSVTSLTGNPQTSIDLSGILALQNVAAGTTVTFRVATWGATNVTMGAWYLNDPIDTSANDFIINGAVTANAPVITKKISLTKDTSDGNFSTTFRGNIVTTGSGAQYVSSILDIAPGYEQGHAHITGTLPTPDTDNIIWVLLDTTGGDIDAVLASLTVSDKFISYQSATTPTNGDFLDMATLYAAPGRTWDALLKFDASALDPVSGGGSLSDLDGALFFNWDFSGTGVSVNALAAVPEPSSLGFLALGGLALMKRRKQSR